MSETLQLMGRAPADRVTQEVAREICLRTGSKAVLAGSISSLGSAVRDRAEGGELRAPGTLWPRSRWRRTAKEDVLKALDEAATSLRGKLGESLGSVQKFDVPLEASDDTFAGGAESLQHGHDDPT